MAWTPQDLVTVRQARASSIKTVRLGDKEITYKSDAELAAVEAAIVKALDQSTPEVVSMRRHLHARYDGRGY